ncbi:phosphoethanolamine--lipid A transferase [Vibrio caribbeanicus]|uniref:phosphoethanolamine transferase n=1 Tax=Vibrio caribbeanicus TaxID=701175 RepID=UPI0030DD0782
MEKALTKGNGLSYFMFSLLLAIYFTVIVNIPVFSELVKILNKLDSVKLGFIISIPIFFIATLNFIFNIFTWPKIAKPFFALLLIVSSIVSYATFNYGILVDTDMVRNIVETNQSEAKSYLSLSSFLWVSLMGILPAFIVLKTKLAQESGNWIRFLLVKLVSMLSSLAVIILIAALYYQDYVSVGRNNSYLNKMIIPTHYVYSIAKFINREYFTTPEPYKYIGLDAKQRTQDGSKMSHKPTVMLLVVGETARTQNYQLNGYPRQTNPYTSKLNITSFQDVVSCGTATAVSVPCMFSQLTRDEFDRNMADNQDNALDILKRAGIDIIWKENDGGDKGVAHNIKKIELDASTNAKWCNGNTCFDMGLLDGLEEQIANMKGNRLIALHLIGSHGPTYFQRYPEEQSFFSPDCPRADIENCSSQQITNTYDNTLRYTDLVLAKAIGKLKALEAQYNTALLYISDHGESLGESGLYLHGMPYGLAPDYQKRVPLLFWMSPGFEQEKSLDLSCLRSIAKKRETHSHDNIFHSLLGIMDIETQAYDPNLDVFNSCRRLG